MHRYGHLFPDALEQLADRLDAARAAARTDPARPGRRLQWWSCPLVRRQMGPDLRGDGGVTEGTRTPDLRDHNPLRGVPGRPDASR